MADRCCRCNQELPAGTVAMLCAPHALEAEARIVRHEAEIRRLEAEVWRLRTRLRARPVP